MFISTTPKAKNN